MSVSFSIEGALEALESEQVQRLVKRQRLAPPEVRTTVEEIVAAVESEGDDALRRMARSFDDVELDRLEVPRSAWRAALAEIDIELKAALQESAEAIATFHRHQLPEPMEIEPLPGVRLGRRAEPLQRVGAYVPGGLAAYPSSVLMGVIPAKAAGVTEVIVCSPPGEDGIPTVPILAACELVGADRLFALGGAGAIAALAYGTESVPRVDKIVGPGNAYVTEAKRQLAGVVASDCLAGPSELLVLADESGSAELIAMELLAQAEHDPEATVCLLTTSPEVAQGVRREIERILPGHPREGIIRTALSNRGALLTTRTLEDGLELCREFAPEHLLLLANEARQLLSGVRNAGATFLGPHSSVVFGDYSSGTNHVLPTAGQARAESGLSTGDFLRWSSYQELDRDGAAAVAGTAETIAKAEGLPAHAAAARRHLPPAAGRSAARTNSASGMARPAYRHIDRYDPGRRPCAVDLSDNTNLFGVPPSAVRAMETAAAERIGRYGSVYADELKRALAQRFGLAPEQIATGCGSDDLIDSAIRVFCPPGGAVAFPSPTFSMMADFARMSSARPIRVPLGPDFELDAEGLLGTGAQVIYVCNPNNPSGNLMDNNRIEQLAAGMNPSGVLLLDEAYADFCGHSWAREAAESERVIVLRTLSKAYGLAGIRVGYAVGPADLIAELEKSRGPFKVGGLAESMAVAALEQDEGWVRETVERTTVNRERLAEALIALGLKCWPSETNFLLVGAPGGNARRFKELLRQLDIGVRAFPGIPQAGDCVRITVGPWSLMERFLAAVKELKNDARITI